MSFIDSLYRLFVALDCSLAEINPLVVTKSGALLALDAKLNLDDNALFRHRDLAGLEDPSEMDPLEFEARKHQLNYIRLSGNVGAMVNGAGLAMATMDLIKAAGAEPANFLDVGGGASAEMVSNGFRIVLGGSPRQGGAHQHLRGHPALRRLGQRGGGGGAGGEVQVPMHGPPGGAPTWSRAGEILEESGLKFTVATDMLPDAAQKVAALVGWNPASTLPKGREEPVPGAAS